MNHAISSLRPGAFDSPGSYLPALSGVYGCYLRSSGTYNTSSNSSSGASSSYPLYLAYDGATNLDTFFAAATPGAVAALPCYDAARANLTQYLLVTVLPTPPDKYACLTCAFYNVAPLATTASAGCDCNDTAWGFPTPDQFGAAYDSTSTAEVRLNVTDPGFGNGVFWSPRQQTASAWGGYFRIAPPTAPGVVTLNLAVCAGCGQNQPAKGYYLGNGFTITFTNYTEGYGSITIKALPSGASAEVDRLQVYLTFVAPPNLNPGQFQTFTTTSPTVTPTSPLTAFPAGPFTAAARDNVTYTSSTGATYTVPSSVDPGQGVFLALHLDLMGQACPAPY
ncbi:hypothetical protein HXX76_015598 [Chlamydomonas incerta]|uniref:Uncharacterized protein n=1 Tax=Chlamydomonas incerta TaxID=51695 RepID=A0A835SLT6_CHLIN|nr:hypothetical protein HXX76_015598 [Chlamydomonas incerta]|eukprot:KAG2423000.1 hypothetical protein HXX76_015598 [Chlamydomonas incerta]